MGAAGQGPKEPIEAVIPMLHAFYGGDLMSWVRDVPVCLLRAWHSAMPRVRAFQALDAVEHTQIATGHSTKAHGRRRIDEWTRLVNGGRAVRGMKASLNQVRQRGIAVRTVPKQA